MNQEKQHLKDLSEIRKLMEQASRFISLSGLSGVSAGIFALIGATLAYWYLDLGLTEPSYYAYGLAPSGHIKKDFLLFFLADAAGVFVLAIGAGIFFTTRKARQKGLPVWNPAVKRMLVNLAIPLVTGGIFCIILVHHRILYLIAPATLLFYGLALLNASKYTFREIRYLGLTEITLGLIAGVYTGYGLLVWAIGFGVLHILYGTMMYLKYER